MTQLEICASTAEPIDEARCDSIVRCLIGQFNPDAGDEEILFEIKYESEGLIGESWAEQDVANDGFEARSTSAVAPLVLELVGAELLPVSLAIAPAESTSPAEADACDEEAVGDPIDITDELSVAPKSVELTDAVAVDADATPVEMLQVESANVAGRAAEGSAERGQDTPLERAQIDAAVLDAARIGVLESGPQGVDAELGGAALERLSNFDLARNAPIFTGAIPLSASLVREPVPMTIEPIAIAVGRSQVVSRSKGPFTQHPTPTRPDRPRFVTMDFDGVDPSLPEARRKPSGPTVLLRRAVREKRSRTKHSDAAIVDFSFVARAFKVFTVLTSVLALLAIELRFIHALDLGGDAVTFLRMVTHMAIGGGVVAVLRPAEKTPKK